MNETVPYVVEFSSAALADLVRLDRHLMLTVDLRVLDLGRDPRPHGYRKLRGSDDAYRVRINDLRAIYRIDDLRRRIVVLRIQKRAEVYR